jgi:hypothetical protein
LHARFTTDAAPGIEINDAILSREESGDRTDGYAGSVSTMIASHDAEGAMRVGERALLDILYPRAVDANRRVVLCFAGNGARVATDTLAIVDDEAVAHADGAEWYHPRQPPSKLT